MRDVRQRGFDAGEGVEEFGAEVGLDEEVAAGEEPCEGVQVRGEGVDEDGQVLDGSSGGPPFPCRVVVSCVVDEAAIEIATNLFCAVSEELS